MLSGFYGQRWRAYFKAAEQSLKNKSRINHKAVTEEIFNWENAWSDQQESYASEPSGDTLEYSKKFLDKYFPSQPGEKGEWRNVRADPFFDPFFFQHDYEAVVLFQNKLYALGYGIFSSPLDVLTACFDIDWYYYDENENGDHILVPCDIDPWQPASE